MGILLLIFQRRNKIIYIWLKLKHGKNIKYTESRKKREMKFPSQWGNINICDNGLLFCCKYGYQFRSFFVRIILSLNDCRYFVAIFYVTIEMQINEI